MGQPSWGGPAWPLKSAAAYALPRLAVPLVIIALAAHRVRRGRARRCPHRHAITPAISERLSAAGQSHLLKHWDSLSGQQQTQLEAEIEQQDLEFLRRAYEATKAGSTRDAIQPPTDVQHLYTRTLKQSSMWGNIGLRALAQGRAAIVLLAGGQGTRLGSDQPKGCFDIGLPSHKSLFQFQAERLLKLQELAQEELTRSWALPLRGKRPKAIRWYIMTSDATHAATEAHFQQHKHFGLEPSQIVFFKQGKLPCLSSEGEVLMASSHSLATAPDGNGGLFAALRAGGVLEDMREHGVQAVDCYCVDNALARLGDPAFLGYCLQANVEVGSRVVARSSACEQVGVFAMRGGACHVLEYSEVGPAEAAAVDADTGTLRYRWANICMHYFSLPFLVKAAEELDRSGAMHSARKVIDTVDGPVEGIKLERFIFDPFPIAKKAALFEVDRSDQFAPVKNAAGARDATPDTARLAVMRQHRRWVEAAGGTVLNPGGVEVSPLLSYAGEGLSQVEGQSYTLAYNSSLQQAEPEGGGIE